MATIHFLQQGKGGVGKSVVASLLVQALRHLGEEVTAFDTDPVNASLASYEDFHAVRIDIVRDGMVDTSAFDELLEGIYGLLPGAHAVVDNGASSFLALKQLLLGDQPYQRTGSQRRYRIFPFGDHGRRKSDPYIDRTQRPGPWIP